MHTYPPVCAIVSYPFLTLKAPKRLRAQNRASGAIDGGAPAPDCKPSGLNRRRLATVTLRVFRSRRRHGNSPFGRKTRSFARFNSSVFFARRANFRVAGEAENRPSGRFGFASVSAFSVSNRRGDRPHSNHSVSLRGVRDNAPYQPPRGQAPFQSLGFRGKPCRSTRPADPAGRNALRRLPRAQARARHHSRTVAPKPGAQQADGERAPGRESPSRWKG